MSSVKVTEEIKADATAVWEMVRDFGGIQKWNGGTVQKIEVEGEGLGAVRTITVPGDILIKEKLEAYDEEGRSFSYSFEGESPLPIDDYLATIKISDAGKGAAKIEWTSTFEPRAGATEEQVVPMIEGIYTTGVASLKMAMER